LNLQSIATGSGFTIPTEQPTAPTTGSMYFDSVGPMLYVYNGTNWRGIMFDE
jgi:hypothetical protein